MKNKISPVISLILLIINIIIIFIVNNIYTLLLLLLVSIIHSIICRTNILKAYKFLYFGLFLSIFTLVLTYVTSLNIIESLLSACSIFLIFTIILIHSYIYKVNNTIKDSAYAISKLFIFLQPLGYNQNKIYTMMLIVICTSFKMSSEVKSMYFHARRMFPKKISIFTSIKILVNLVSPFINKVMFRNDLGTMSLINKDYSIHNKNVKIYKDYKPTKLLICYLIIFEIVFIGCSFIIF